MTCATSNAILAYEDAQKALVAYVLRSSALLASASELLCNDTIVTDLNLPAPPSSPCEDDSLRILTLHAPSDLPCTASRAYTSSTLSAKFSAAREHLSCLEKRILDKTCRILVAGDVNAGKSALINALLRRDLLPTDEQPTTCLLTEVVDASNNNLNNEREEIHYIPSFSNLCSSAPIRKHAISELADLARTDAAENDFFDAIDDFSRSAPPQQNEPSTSTLSSSASAAMLRVFCDAHSNESLLVGNSNVDVHLIDSPGLNRDIQKTIELVMSQREIDVIVFLVSSENHMTLSSHEFLKKASEEKKYIFVVVSKMDRIKDKARCRHRILNQIKEVSPLTYARADQLVHFVAIPVETFPETDSGCDTPAKSQDGSISPVFQTKGPSASILANLGHSHAITKVEDALKVFILEKRAASKLSPAKTYLENLLFDLSRILGHQVDYYRVVQDTLQSELNSVSRTIAKIDANRLEVSGKIEDTSHTACENIEELVEMRFAKLPDMLLARARSGAVPYPGIFSIRSYLNNLKSYLVSAVHDEVDVCRALTNKEIVSAWRAIRAQRSSWLSSSASLLSDNKIFSLPAFGGFSLASTYQLKSIQDNNNSDIEQPYNLDYATNVSLLPVRYACSITGLLRFQPSRLLWRREPPNGAAERQRHLIDWLKAWMSPDAIPAGITSLVKRGTCMTSALLVGRTMCAYMPPLTQGRGIESSAGALGLISRFGAKRICIVLCASAGIAASVAGFRFVSRLSERIPEYMAHTLLDHLRESRYAETLGRQVCETAQQALSLSLSEANTMMANHLQALRASHAGLGNMLDETISRMDKLDEIKGRSEVALEQISLLSVEI